MTKPILILACVCACSSQYIAQPKQPNLDDAIWSPPNTTSLVINDVGHAISREVLERVVYEQSIATITCKMRAEQEMLDTGRATRDQLCNPDTLVDARGGQHFKPYCHRAMTR